MQRSERTVRSTADDPFVQKSADDEPTSAKADIREYCRQFGNDRILCKTTKVTAITAGTSVHGM
jgi:hypothetical protein